MITTIEEAEAVCGKLENTSKMPCQSYSISAQFCKRGGKLHKLPNSICKVCYARKYRYLWKNVQAPLIQKLSNWENPKWVEAITFLIGATNETGFFRWFSSGDLQGDWMFKKIVQVCENLPNIKFWLPTHEFPMVTGILRRMKKAGEDLPDNLVIRFSADLVDGEPPVKLAKRLGVNVSASVTKDFTCPASKQDGKCLTCRKCWDRNEFYVSYKKH